MARIAWASYLTQASAQLTETRDEGAQFRQVLQAGLAGLVPRCARGSTSLPALLGCCRMWLLLLLLLLLLMLLLFYKCWLMA